MSLRCEKYALSSRLLMANVVNFPLFRLTCETRKKTARGSKMYVYKIESRYSEKAALIAWKKMSSGIFRFRNNTFMSVSETIFHILMAPITRFRISQRCYGDFVPSLDTSAAHVSDAIEKKKQKTSEWTNECNHPSCRRSQSPPSFGCPNFVKRWMTLNSLTLWKLSGNRFITHRCSDTITTPFFTLTTRLIEGLRYAIAVVANDTSIKYLQQSRIMFTWRISACNTEFVLLCLLSHYLSNRIEIVTNQ